MPPVRRRNPTVQGDAAKAADPNERIKVISSIQGREQAPSSRAQATFVNWKQLGTQLGQPFDAESIPYSKLRQMRRDPMISFGLHYVKTPLVRAPWHIEASGGSDTSLPAQVAAFVDAALRPIYARYIFQRCLALDFGHSPMVKRFQLSIPTETFIDNNGNEMPVWNEGSVEAVTWKPFVALQPDKAEPAWVEKTGEFDGIKYEGADDEGQNATGSSGGGGQDKPNIDVYHALWGTNERDSVFGSLYGYPRIGYAYRYWWSYWFRWALYDRYFERTAVPPVAVYHPDGVYEDPDSGETLEFREVAIDAGTRIRSNGIITLPSEVVETLDDRSANLRQWEVSYIEGGDPNINFDDTFNYLDVMKLRSMWVPEQAFIEGEGGSSSRNVAAQMAEIFIQSQSNLMEEIDDEINRFLIPQLVAINFPEFEGTVRKVTTGFSQEDVEFIKQIIQLVGQADWQDLGIDLRKAAERAGLPLLTPAQQQEQRNQMIRDSGNTVPSTDPPANGETQVVEDDNNPAGFSYVQMNHSIHLSNDAEMMAALPTSRHFADEQSKKLAVRLQKLYSKDYRARIKDFANFISNAEIELSAEDLNEIDSEALQTLMLAEEEDGVTSGEVAVTVLTAVAAEKLARELVEAWTWPERNLADLATSTANLYGKIFSLALRNEADATGFQKQPSPERAEEWVAQHTETLVESTHSSLKSEIETALADVFRRGIADPDDVAKEIRSHFSDRPVSKSETLAVTETVDAWNTATLMLGEANGIKQAQALDAQKGPTDRECEDRNSVIFSLEEAFEEDAKQRHPRCTLEWRLLRPEIELSVETHELPPDTVAVFNEEKQKVFMSDSASRSEEKRYMLTLGASLEAVAEESDRV